MKRLCDTATILRGGKKVATCNPRQETAASLARMMVGGEIGEVKAAGRTPVDACRGSSFTSFRSSRTIRMACGSKTSRFEVRGGEILGIAGVAGNGQDELFSALSGERAGAGSPAPS